MMIRIVIAWLVLLTASCQQSSKNDRTIETYLSGLEKAGFNGSVLVARNHEVIISRGYGFRDSRKQLPNTPATVFDIGSITKQFTAAAILKLEMQGKLSTTDKLSRYFDPIPDDKATITLHDLLRHQSGLQSTIGKDYDPITQADFVSEVMRSPLRFETGSRFSYSNIGYSLLAIIIEQVSGQPYETYLYENLWQPAQMEVTGYTRPGFDTTYVATGYYRDGSVWGKPVAKAWDTTAPYWHLAGNGGILSTTEDLFKWHRALMTTAVLSEDALKKFYSPPLRAGENEDAVYAYGWDVSRTSRNTRQVWHNGTNSIFYADFLRYIDEGITLIMLSNQSHPNFDQLTREISRMLFHPGYLPEIPVTDTPANRAFTDELIQTIRHSGPDSARKLFEGRANGVELLEFEMRDKGFELLDSHQPDWALQVFEMNVTAFSNSAKALEALGEAYMETGKNDLALKYFKQSLARQPDNPFATRMIQQLGH